ncbi:hypothetical protein MAUB1S_04526 [Mycolicibacterium aubagnense]
MANARLKPALTRINEISGVAKSNSMNSRWIPTSIAAGWNICVASTSNRNSERPRNFRRAV